MSPKLKIRPSNLNLVGNCPKAYDFLPDVRYDDDYVPQDRPILAKDNRSKSIIVHRLAAAMVNLDKAKIEEIRNYPGFAPYLEEAALGYYDFMAEIRNEPESLKIDTEVDVPLAFLHPEMLGRVDCIVDSPYLLTIVDLKFGNEKIKAENNLQLLAYTIGAEARSPVSHPRFRLIIYDGVTKRCSEWHITNEEAYILSEKLKSRITEAMSDEKSIIGGPQCVHCLGKDNCKGYYQHFLGIDELHDELKSEDWKKIAERNKELRRSELDNIDRQIKDKIEKGQLEGFYITKKEVNKWNPKKEKEIIEKLTQRGYRPEEIIAQKIKTPAELRKQGVNIEGLEELMTTTVRRDTNVV